MMPLCVSLKCCQRQTIGKTQTDELLYTANVATTSPLLDDLANATHVWLLVLVERHQHQLELLEDVDIAEPPSPSVVEAPVLGLTVVATASVSDPRLAADGG